MDVPEEGKAMAEFIDNKAKELWSQATSRSQSLLVNFGQLKMFKDRRGNTLIFFEAEQKMPLIDFQDKLIDWHLKTNEKGIFPQQYDADEIRLLDRIDLRRSYSYVPLIIPIATIVINKFDIEGILIEEVDKFNSLHQASLGSVNLGQLNIETKPGVYDEPYPSQYDELLSIFNDLSAYNARQSAGGQGSDGSSWRGHGGSSWQGGVYGFN